VVYTSSGMSRLQSVDPGPKPRSQALQSRFRCSGFPGRVIAVTERLTASWRPSFATPFQKTRPRYLLYDRDSIFVDVRTTLPGGRFSLVSITGTGWNDSRHDFFEHTSKTGAGDGGTGEHTS